MEIRQGGRQLVHKLTPFVCGLCFLRFTENAAFCVFLNGHGHYAITSPEGQGFLGKWTKEEWEWHANLFDTLNVKHLLEVDITYHL